MSDSVAFIGDVHGCLPALQSMIGVLSEAGVNEIVLLGDYINKGADGPAVINYLISLDSDDRVVALRGNHESALLDCLDSGDVRPLLRMSGAPTIRSYVGGDVGPHVADSLRASVPLEHVEFLRKLPERYLANDVVASHKAVAIGDLFSVSAHVYVGSTPRLSEYAAEIDTGCGSPQGILTGFLWPSRSYVQVDMNGRVIRPVQGRA
ncbi:metallophosphoesterase [Promicromonospora sp. MEB111]|uniref:metallophosphoesterase n=1 Tax=Promicromonospora sp. MEB111 TaxID=3040301 RepID=UPI00254ACDA4|nr:metallophosphoesterase [Promicromonospora sp. MEB111]